MKQIALSIEQMKYLETLGLDTSDASMCWNKYGDKMSKNDEENFYLDIIEYSGNIGAICNAYTIQDIMKKLPKSITEDPDDGYLSLMKKPRYYEIAYYHYSIVEDYYLKRIYGESPLECGYNMLIWCIENNYIKTNKV